MKKLLLLLLFSGPLLWSQGAQRSAVASLPNGGNFLTVIPNASVYVCTFNAPLNCISPSTYVSLYSDPALTQSLPQPIVADASGYYNYYVNGGTQVVEKVCAAFNQCFNRQVFIGTQEIIGVGTITGVTASTGLTGGGSSGSVTLAVDTTAVPLLGSANVFSNTQTAPNFVGNLTGNVTGTVSGNVSLTAVGNQTIVSSLTLPQLNAVTPGAFLTGQMNPTSEFLEGGMTNPNIASIQGTNYSTDALTIGQLIPSVSTVIQSTGLASYSQNASTATKDFGLYSQVLSGANGAQNWGTYSACNDFSFGAMSFTGVHCYGEEIDENVQNSATTGAGLIFGGSLGGNSGGSVGAISVPAPTSGSWGYGLHINDFALLNASSPSLYSGASASVNGTSYPAIFVATDGAGIHHGILLYADPLGALTTNGVTTTNGAFDVGTLPGDFVVYNNRAIKSDTSTHSAWFRLIYGTSTNKVSIDADNQGSVFGGSVSNTNGVLLPSSLTGDHGNSTKIQLSDGTGASGNCVKYDANGNVTDAGAPCGGGGGGGVTSINSTAGAFTFSGTGVSCTSTTCTFSGPATSGSLPATCTVGALWTNPSPTGTNNVVYECYATNTWISLQPSLSGIPSIGANSGAGTSPTISFVAGASDQAGFVNLTTGSSPSASAGVFTITFGNTSYPAQPVCEVTPASAATAALSGTGALYVSQGSSSSTVFVASIGSSALTGATAYKWGYTCKLP